MCPDLHHPYNVFFFFFLIYKFQARTLTYFSSHRSAFFLFCADFRPKVKVDTPGLSIGDTAKRLGEMWNGSSAENKQPYEKKAAKLKEKYDKVNGHVIEASLFLFYSITTSE